MGHSVRDRQPPAQLTGRFVRGFAVEGHERGGAAGRSGDLRAPFVAADARYLDEVLAPVDRFCELMHVHMSTPSPAGGDRSQNLMKAIVETGFKGHVAQEFIPKRDDKIASLKQGVQICDV